jgi:hypothetical protein
MTPQRWTVVGWACIVAAVGLAIAAAVQALDAVSVHTFSPSQIFSSGVAAPAELIRGFIFAVVSGAAFFTGLGCFFWSALLDSRQQLARIVELLQRGR